MHVVLHLGIRPQSKGRGVTISNAADLSFLLVFWRNEQKIFEGPLFQSPSWVLVIFGEVGTLKGPTQVC